jgi:hypothetical protein
VQAIDVRNVWCVVVCRGFAVRRVVVCCVCACKQGEQQDGVAWRGGVAVSDVYVCMCACVHVCARAEQSKTTQTKSVEKATKQHTLPCVFVKQRQDTAPASVPHNHSSTPTNVPEVVHQPLLQAAQYQARIRVSFSFPSPFSWSVSPLPD